MQWVRTPLRPAARRLRALALGVSLTVAGAVAGMLVVPLAVRGMVRAVMWLFQACVWMALSLSAGTTAWTMLATVGRVAASTLVTRQAFTALAVLVVVAAGALYGLQRVLGPDRDSEES